MDILRAHFIRRYEDMDPSTMWRLRTGKIVEVCLYNAVLNDLQASEQAMRWVISSKDAWVNGLFTEEELEEIYFSRIAPEASKETEEVWTSLRALGEVSLLVYSIFPYLRILTQVVENDGRPQKAPL
jgi:hypothetical protein